MLSDLIKKIGPYKWQAVIPSAITALYCIPCIIFPCNIQPSIPKLFV